jgi:protein-S-isoprenylcysteine O-methyltransferase Ste14
MSKKVEPELVTSGPYQLVRHPIYSGILLAGVGTAVALSWMWLIAMVLARSTSSTARPSKSTT